MSRARNLKPGFFKNEELAELPFEYRILFQGLWCLADRDGRLEDRPKRIKAEVFPYDEVDVSAGLDALARAGFIVRYASDSGAFIQVVAFAKHQNPHCKEQASVIPPPPEKSITSEQHRTCTVHVPEIPELAGLIPDSLNPITDSREKALAPSEPPKPDRSPSGSRLPPDWQPSAEDIAFAERERPDVDWRVEADKFRDYWHGKPGKDGRKTTWPGTWRNWIRRADRRPGARAGPHAAPSKQMQGVANLLGVDPHDLTDNRSAPVVRPTDSDLLGGALPAQPRRLPGR